MTKRRGSPRIAPVPSPDLDGESSELLRAAGSPGSPATNIFATLVRHPGLFRKWLPFAGKLLAGKLPPRERELVILRTGWRCRSEYEWGQHVLIGGALGVTDEELRRVQAGPEAPGWSRSDAALLRAADELHDQSCISDATWSTLSDRYDDRQLIELLMLVGQYHLVAFTLNSLGVEREAGVPGFEG
jgi:4-carboxymuconolactone decarboxylase